MASPTVRLLTVCLCFGRGAAMALAPGANVLVVGNGAVQCLAARLAAICGYKTTLAVVAQTREKDEKVVFDSKYPKGSLPLTIMPITGDDIVEADIEHSINEADGIIVAFDSERTLPKASMNVFMPTEGAKLSCVSMMSRYLNGDGMGFTASAAKFAANPDIWAGGKMVPEYKEMESRIKARCAEVGAKWSIIRAGTLKGGGSADASDPEIEDAGGDARFLNPAFYTMGQQDIVNWRLLFDSSGLGVEMSAGDTLPGPGFTAALTATDRVGSGDCHRGAVAMALVQALGCDAAAGKDFSIKAKEGREFPADSVWPAMFAGAK